MKEFTLTRTEVCDIASAMNGVKIAVIGDVCLDIYWRADMKKSRLSRETPHYPLPVVSEVFSPGAGGNVINNLAALSPAKLMPISVVANDWRGFLLTQYFTDHGISTDFLVTRQTGLTPAYAKPIRLGISEVVYEDPRLDFENFKPLDVETETKLIAMLDDIAKACDVIAVTDQFTYGVVTPAIRAKLAEIAKTTPVIADSRDRIGDFTGVIVKPNEVETAAALGMDITSRDTTMSDYAELATALQKMKKAPVIVTLGDKGAIWCDGSEPIYAPTVKARGETDIVGAGDTFLSAFSAAYAATGDGGKSLAFANLASAVTVKKIGTTGTATRQEILAKWEEYYA